MARTNQTARRYWWWPSHQAWHECANVQFSIANGPVPFERYGEYSPILACDNIKMTFTFEYAKSKDALIALFSTGAIATDADILNDWSRLDQYLDIPILCQICNNTWKTNSDENLWLLQLQGHLQYQGMHVDDLATHGQLQTIKWLYANGACRFSYQTLHNAKITGHLKIATWIHTNSTVISRIWAEVGCPRMKSCLLFGGCALSMVASGSQIDQENFDLLFLLVFLILFFCWLGTTSGEKAIKWIWDHC